MGPVLIRGLLANNVARDDVAATYDPSGEAGGAGGAGAGGAGAGAEGAWSLKFDPEKSMTRHGWSKRDGSSKGKATSPSSGKTGKHVTNEPFENILFVTRELPGFYQNEPMVCIIRELNGPDGKEWKYDDNTSIQTEDIGTEVLVKFEFCGADGEKMRAKIIDNIKILSGCLRGGGKKRKYSKKRKSRKKSRRSKKKSRRSKRG